MLIQAEESVVHHMLSSTTINALQNCVAPTQEQVMHHLKLRKSGAHPYAGIYDSGIGAYLT
jgi:hypothetical protein